MRAEIRERRDDFVTELPDGDKNLAFSVAPSPLAALFKPGKTVAGYIPVGSEADPARLLQAAENADCVTALPHVTSIAAPMRFLKWNTADSLKDGPFGLLQPAETNPEIKPDIILVPLIAFDRALNRLGQGAGHYDRALALLDGAIAIGIAWSVQEEDSLAVDAWDIPLDAILTEKEWIVR
ncbi:MAG: 5-formyltetrahydrofolate cyclo-ligase [Sphingorhabdus sp.]